jgi:glutamine synthetase
VIRHAAATSRNVRFEGNCYTQEWAEEAQRRGLPVAHSTPDALRLFLTPENRSLLADLGVMSEREIHAYYETRLHQFNTTMNIDMGVLASMVREGVLPALAKQITLEGNALSHLPAAAAEGPCGVVLEKLGRLKADLHEAVQRLEALQADLDTLPIEEEAEGMVRKAIPLLEGIRGLCNEVERNVALEFWPYPRYRELATLK